MNEELDNLEKQLEDFEHLKIRIRQEGFHYCFKHYSSFKEIEDEEFHKFRKEYMEDADRLENYINTKIFEIQEKIDKIEE